MVQQKRHVQSFVEIFFIVLLHLQIHWIHTKWDDHEKNIHFASYVQLQQFHSATEKAEKRAYGVRDWNDTKRLVAQAPTMNLWKIIENKFSFFFRSFVHSWDWEFAVCDLVERENVRFFRSYQLKNIAERKLHNSGNVMYSWIHVFVEWCKKRSKIEAANLHWFQISFVYKRREKFPPSTGKIRTRVFQKKKI